MSLIAGTIVTKITADNKQFKSAMKDTKKSLADVNKSSKTVTKGFSGMFKGLAVGAGLAGLAKITRETVKLAAALEQTRISLQTLTGSKLIGNQLIKDIKELANVTPFTSQALFGASKSLLAFDIAAKDITRTLRFLGDVSAGTGKDVRELSVIFGKIKSTGKLMGQELNQLIDAGFNPLQIIAQKTGKSILQLKEDMRKGLITFDQVEDAFVTATSKGGKFFDLMNKQSASFNGRLSTLKDALQQVGENIGKIVIPSLKIIVDKLIVAATALKGVTAGEGTTGQKAVVGAGIGLGGMAAFGVAGALFADVINSITLAVFATSKEWSGTATVLERVKKAIQLFTRWAKTSTSLISRAVGVFVGVLAKLAGMITAVGTAAAIAAVEVAIIVDSFKDISEDSKDVGMEISGFSIALTSMKNIFSNVAEALGELISIVAELLTKIPLIGPVIGTMIESFSALIVSTKKFSTDMIELFSKMFKSVIELGKLASDNFADFITGGRYSDFVDGDINLDQTQAEKDIIKNARRQAREKVVREAKNVADVNKASSAFSDMMEKLRLMAKKVAEVANDAIADALAERARTSNALDANIAAGLNLQMPEMIKMGASTNRAGAFGQGSVEANRVLTRQSDDSAPEKKIEKNTKKMADILNKILNDGVNLNNVAVAN